ncbi:MAG: cobalamin-binding protein [Gammaproteobacteria bacterium]|jgi:iron complex transport system substrate-binding protein|nr:cobalamin-binding protein [Gammaproteobacteria bacterium]MBT4606067.1 cobalamin-binding protein [Thiotrichales bacterium]MBT3471880.1 cobalamin-binding protein [Gammaproteobacteria bacterium]MBT3967127.1 cobalamin-binding protein [Gammaproteobacteria bacterium]MBT4082023.1 cobalamin-binding protein [Gammaproteobacteria bacterium]
MKKLLFPLLLLLPLCAAVAEPPKRIISLAPHLTEMLFEIGAGEQLVGTVSYSNYPEAATRIPVIGSYNRLDLEAILAQRPDLILGWESGNATAELERLRALGIPLHISEPRKLEDVATVMESLGTLIGSEQQAKRRASAYRQRLQQLRQQYQQQRPLRVFYQVWNRPLITINGEQIISHVIELCGGINVFANLDSLSPQISVEAVLERDPQVIVASGMDASRPEWLDGWSHYPTLQAVQQGDLYHVPPDILQRHGPRLLQGAEQLCKALQKARE